MSLFTLDGQRPHHALGKGQQKAAGSLLDLMPSKGAGEEGETEAEPKSPEPHPASVPLQLLASGTSAVGGVGGTPRARAESSEFSLSTGQLRTRAIYTGVVGRRAAGETHAAPEPYLGMTEGIGLPG